MSNCPILENIARHVALSDTEQEYFLASLEVREVQRKELLLTQGQSCKKLYYVEAGSLRAFNVNKGGRESTVMFAVEDWWITDMNCFVNQQPALLSIEALEQSRIVAVDFQVLEELYGKIPKLERFFRILFQKAYIREQLRVLQAISLTTVECYLEFIEKYPTIVEKITQKQIASYLGVTPEFLSSLKHK